jgi:hypothetical protein
MSKRNRWIMLWFVIVEFVLSYVMITNMNNNKIAVPILLFMTALPPIALGICWSKD